jgi:hypothetical protein
MTHRVRENGISNAPPRLDQWARHPRRFMSDLSCVVVSGDGVYSGAQGFDYF